MALPNAITLKRGVKDTDDALSQEKPIEIGNKIWMHDPNANKGLGWALRNGERLPTANHIFGHLEDSPHSNWVEFAGADETSQDVTGIRFKTGHGARLDWGSRIYFPRTKEIIRLDAAMSSGTPNDTVAVTRNFGIGVATDHLLTGDKGLIIAPGFEQGFTTQKGLSNQTVYKTFATSEVSWPVQVANIEAAELSRVGDPFVRALNKSWKASKDQMEGELFFGAKKVDSSTYSTPITVSEGIANFVTTNVYTAQTLSRMDLWDILAEWTGLNKDGGVIMCSNTFKTKITTWAIDKTNYEQKTQMDGMTINKVLTPSGMFDLVEIDLFNQEPYLMGTAFLVPSGRIAYRPLIHYDNLDIRYNPISRDEVHSKEGEIYGVYGWHFKEEEMWAKIDGMRFAA